MDTTSVTNQIVEGFNHSVSTVDQLLRDLALQLGTSVEHILEVYTQYYFRLGIIYCIIGFFSIIGLVWCIKVLFIFVKKTQDEPKDEDKFFAHNLFSILGILFCFGLLMAMFIQGVPYLISPEATAIKDILSTVSSMSH